MLMKENFIDALGNNLVYFSNTFSIYVMKLSSVKAAWHSRCL